jgi:hypothetical protein
LRNYKDYKNWEKKCKRDREISATKGGLNKKWMPISKEKRSKLHDLMRLGISTFLQSIITTTI